LLFKSQRCVSSGEVNIIYNDHVIETVVVNGRFREMALVDEDV